MWPEINIRLIKVILIFADGIESECKLTFLERVPSDLYVWPMFNMFKTRNIRLIMFDVKIYKRWGISSQE